MVTRSNALLTGSLVWLAALPALAQFEAPPNSLALDDKGTVEAIQGDVIKFRDSKNEVWLIKLSQDTTLALASEADSDYLRPGLTVELVAEVDDKGVIEEELKEISVLSSKSKPSLGLFPADGEEDAKPARSLEAGEYKIRGKVASIKGGKLLIVAGRNKVTATAGEELKVKISLDDPSAAQFGDEVQVKAWYYDQGKPNPTLNRPGQALAEDVHITLANPPVTGKRGVRGAIKGALRPKKAAVEPESE